MTPADWQFIRSRVTPDKIGFIVMMEPRRVGGLAFLTFLEHRHFTPVPLPKDDYELFQIQWEGTLLVLCLIPGSKRMEAHAIAKELGLRFADGVPHIISTGGAVHFPIDLPNVFTVENVPGHFVYKNNQAEQKTAFDYEDEAVEREVAKSMEKLRQYNAQKTAK